MASGSSAAMKKKSFDFPNHNYRDAINRLKVMLADTYTAPPTKFPSNSSIFKSVTDDETDTATENTIIERPAIKEVSKYFPYKSYSTLSNASYLHKAGVSNSLQVPCEFNIP